MEKPQFSKAQMNDSTEFMRTNLRGKYDYKETSQMVSDYQAPQQESEGARMARLAKEQQGNLLTQWQKLYSAGNAADKRAAAQSLLGNPQLMEMGITNIDMSDGKNVNLIYANGTSRTIPLYTTVDGKEVQVSPTQWAAQGTELHGVTDSKQFDKYKGDTFQNVTDWSGVNAVRTVAPQETVDTTDYSSQIKKVVANIPYTLFDEEQDDVVSGLQSALAPYDIRVTPSGTAGDYVTIEIPGVATKEFPVDATFEAGMREYKKNITDWINSTVTSDNAKGLVKSGGVDYTTK
jgi:hypothetical protein